MDEIIEEKLKKCKASYLKVQTTQEDVWFYYIILEPECDAIWMDFLFGYHYKINKNGSTLDIYAINLKACYKNGSYSIRCLIDTVIHELLHKDISSEGQVYNATRKLLKGYEYPKINISKKDGDDISILGLLENI